MNNKVISLKDDNIFEKNKIYVASCIYNDAYNAFINVSVNSELMTINYR